VIERLLRPPRLFLISPADCGAKRARILARPDASFPLALQLQRGEATLGDVFSFLSGLYFRGKLTYAQCFGNVAPLVITPADGLWHPDRHIDAAQLARWAATPIELNNPRYTGPLKADAERIAASMPSAATVVLLGSLATPKYLDVLAPPFTDRLLVPQALVGLGDMSRGAVLLRAVRAGRELEYVAASSLPRRRARSAA
jgi:hypothetical protein